MPMTTANFFMLHKVKLISIVQFQFGGKDMNEEEYAVLVAAANKKDRIHDENWQRYYQLSRCDIPKPIWRLWGERSCPKCDKKLSNIKGYRYMTIYECTCGYEWASYDPDLW